MKRIIRTFIWAFIISSLLTVTVLAEGFIPSLEVDESQEGKITVTVSSDAGNVDILESKKPSLSIPCEFEAAYVKYGEEVVESSIADGEITFTVEKPGDYVIIEGKAPVTDDDNKDDGKPSTGHSLENVTGNNKGGEKEPEISHNIKEVIVLTIGDKQASVFGNTVVNDVAPVISNDRTMLPIRFVVEALGGSVQWFDEYDLIKITLSDTVIEIYVGLDEAYVNGNAVALDSPAFIENSRTYVPLRFVAETLRAEVIWDSLTRQVVIIP